MASVGREVADVFRHWGRGIARVLPIAWPFILYGVGILHWLRAFHFAQLVSLDWRLTRAYQSILAAALTEGRIPYLSSFTHYTNRYLGTPETPLSPQFLLVPWMEPWTFNVFNLLVLYTVGCLGLWWIKRRYRLGVLAFTALFLLFNFNGCITARVAMGHTMWYGYYFLPFFYVALSDVLEDRNTKQAVLVLVATFGFMALQGSFHLTVWCWMFVGLAALFAPKRIPVLTAAIVWTIALLAFRILPTAVTLHGIPLQFLESYPTLGTFFDGLTAIPSVAWMRFGRFEGWSELDCYVGFAGLALLIGFAWVYPWRNPNGRIAAQWAFYPAILGMVLLSLSPVYKHVFDSGIPLLSSQRVPSRFAVIPVTACIFLAAIRMQRYLNEASVSKRTRWLLALLLCLIALSLNAHSIQWSVGDAEVQAWASRFDPAKLKPRLIDPNMADSTVRIYVHAVWLGAAVSGVAALAWVIACFRLGYRATRASGPAAGKGAGLAE